MVPPGRIELPIQSYQDCVIPFNYGGLFLSVLLIYTLLECGVIKYMSINTAYCIIRQDLTMI